MQSTFHTDFSPFSWDQGGKKNAPSLRTSTALGVDKLDTSHILSSPLSPHSNPHGCPGILSHHLEDQFPTSRISL